MFTKPAPTPPYTVFNIIFTSGTKPPIGVNVSCIVLTAPVSAAVVTVAYSEENTVPNRTSFLLYFLVHVRYPFHLMPGSRLVQMS